MPVTCFLILRPKADPMTSALTLPGGFLMKWPPTSLPSFFRIIPPLKFSLDKQVKPERVLGMNIQTTQRSWCS